MTGYGKAEITADSRKFTVEVRSLNGKQSDLNLRMSAGYRSLEPVIRKELTSKIQRGKADVTLTVENLQGAANTALNTEAVKSYFATISELCVGLGVNPHDATIMAAILRMPDVLNTNNEEPDEQEIEAVIKCCTEAFTMFDEFRVKEGAVLIKDIMSRITLIENGLREIEPFEQGRVETVRTRIMTELDELKLKEGADKNRFEQELIYYLEKMDITEEKVRLEQHCKYFVQTAETEENPGRKLGFIAQEIGREINTIGSKASEVNIQKIVVGMKDELEKIKEQLLNIL
jgi:uncharacterized protein (TIGR00255 family)